MLLPNGCFCDKSFKVGPEIYSLEQSTTLMQQSRLNTDEYPAVAAHSVSSPNDPAPNTRQALHALPLQSEVNFYSQYRWCLNAFPTIREVANHLSEELHKVDRVQEGWQRYEVLTNVFLLSCAITDTIDDYLAGNTYEFSKIQRLLPISNSGIRALERVFHTPSRLRVGFFSKLRRWREVWATALTEFLRHSLISDDCERSVLAQQQKRLLNFLPTEFPGPVWSRRPRIPAFFRSRDFAPSDCLELGRKYLAAYPEPARPVLVLGLRTAGSYLAPLLCAFLSSRCQHVHWLAVRPRTGLASWEQIALRQAALKKARVLVLDESIHSGQTLARTVNLLRQAGFSDADMLMLNPVEPAFPEWKNSRVLESLSKVAVIALEPGERYKQRLLESDAVQARLNEYFKSLGYVEIRILATPKTEELNRKWRTQPPERVDVRLKRVYEVHLTDASGADEVRHVLAKSVGWGWLGYHAFIAGQQLAEFVPPVLGLRDGILFTEWFPQTQESDALVQNREALVEFVASYVAARARRLRLHSDPAPRLAREGRHKGFEILAASLSRAYSSRIVAALKRPQIHRELSRQNCPASVLTDSKMSREEWVVAASRLLKGDFEHHGQGKNELGMTDPAFDLAGAIFHFQLSEKESAALVRSYVKQSGDVNAEERLFLNKLVAGLWAQNLATLGLEDPRLPHRRKEFHEQYLSAWNFLVAETVRECGKLCQHPRKICWHSPLVVADIDGVLDRMVFGFPCTTSAGIKAISLLHMHGFAVAVNTARTLEEVKLYCRAYGFAGGVAEYGSILWDAVRQREQVLVSPESLQQLEEVQNALQRIPGVFLNDDYRYSLRGFTYQNGRTMPLPPMLVQDLLASLKVDRIHVHQTGLDTALVAKEVNKGAGLVSLLAFVGMSTTGVQAVGDSEPDLAMFRVACQSFAPGNVTCRREAQLLGCHIADAVYQTGLLEIVRKIVHPEGSRCDRCLAAEERWPKNNNLFASLLGIADQGPLSLLLRNWLDPSVLSIFRR
jgi:hydroxymethylpyrimidine pyrophosphatase-like HAD family hydrolase